MGADYYVPSTVDEVGFAVLVLAMILMVIFRPG